MITHVRADVRSDHSHRFVCVSQCDASIAFDTVMTTHIGFVVVLIISIILQGVQCITFLNTAGSQKYFGM